MPRPSLPLLLAVTLLAAPALAAEPATSEQLTAVYEQASSRFGSGDFAAVVALLAPLSLDAASPPPLLTLLAAAYLELGRAAEADALLAAPADRPEAGAPMLYHAARAALAREQPDRAEALLARAAEKAPTGLGARLLGLRRGAAGRFAEAHALLTPYIAANPGDGEARLGAAYAALELGRTAEAGELLAGLPEKAPAVRLLRGRVFLDTGRPDEAITQLEPLVGQSPPTLDADLHWSLADAYLQVGKSARAVELLEGRTGGRLALVLQLARAYQQSGDPDGVLATVAPLSPAFAQPAAIAPNERRLYAALAELQGRALMAGSRWAEAATALQAATHIDPQLTTAWQYLAQALHGSGSREEAQEALRRFQELSRPDA